MKKFEKQQEEIKKLQEKQNQMISYLDYLAVKINRLAQKIEMLNKNEEVKERD